MTALLEVSCPLWWNIACILHNCQAVGWLVEQGLQHPTRHSLGHIVQLHI